MKMNKVIILVATHKPDKFYQDDVYKPIYVGRAISSHKEAMTGILGDDTGDNISEKNPMYCELTAQYWAWKNLKNVEYIGLCHYRRYFETRITNENIDKILGNKYDVLLVSPMIERRNMGRHLIMTSCAEDVYLLLYVIKNKFPEYYSDTEKYLNDNKGSLFNMFVMKKDTFDQFATWQFSVLKEMEKTVRLSNYSRMRRLFGYLGEMLLPIWCTHNKLSICYDNIVPMIGDKYKPPFLMPLRKLYNNLVFKMLRQKIFTDIKAVEVGLKNDGIINH